jgi:outer membrane protein OmpA-like peptidoglycan-associated protein
MKKLVIASCVAASMFAGCSDMDESRKTAAADNSTATSPAANTNASAGATARGYLWSERMEGHRRRMETVTRGTGVGVTQTPDNALKLDIPSDLSFDVGRSVIKSQFAPVLDQFAQSLRDSPNVEIGIIGHTDSTGTDAINDPLSMQRASVTRDYLVTRGLSPEFFRIDGRGSREPIADNRTSAGRAQNRRVEIFVREKN